MPLNARIDPATGVTIFSATGELMVGETRTALESFFDSASPEAPTRNLWDLRHVQLTASLKDITELVDLVRQREKDREGGRVAIVTSSAPALDVMKLYETRRGRIPVEMKLFLSPDLEEAMRWLNEAEGGSPPEG